MKEKRLLDYHKRILNWNFRESLTREIEGGHG